MSTETASRCRSCGAPIIWAFTTANDVLIPLDAEPDADGNVTVERRLTGRYGGLKTTATVLGPLDVALLAPDVERYMPHHATCPQASQWRHRP